MAIFPTIYNSAESLDINVTLFSVSSDLRAALPALDRIVKGFRTLGAINKTKDVLYYQVPVTAFFFSIVMILKQKVGDVYRIKRTVILYIFWEKKFERGLFWPRTSLLRRGIFRLSGRLGNGERGNKARVVPRALPFFQSPRFLSLFLCFLAISLLKEPGSAEERGLGPF